MKKINPREKRKMRIRARIFGTLKRPRLVVFRSNKHIYAQLIDDEQGHTLVWGSDFELKENKKMTKTESAFLVGKLLAQKAKIKKIRQVVFDRNGYRFHGRIKALASGAREAGLEF